MQNFSDTYFEELLHINNDSKLCNINLLRKNKPPAPMMIRKDNSWSICQLSCCCTSEYAQTRMVCSNESDPQSAFVFTWPLLTNQTSNLFWSNYKFSLHMRAEAPNQKLACIHKEIVQVVVFVNRWRKWPGWFPGIARNAGNHGNTRKFHKSDQTLYQTLSQTLTNYVWEKSHFKKQQEIYNFP